MIKFTPGEWIVKELLSSWGVFAVNEGERTGVADCLEYADARLIAAAPEMYRLLLSLLYRCVIIDDCAVDEIKQLITSIDEKETEHE